MTESTPRVVSLLCAATEIVSALGLRELLVGRSHECDHPPGVEDLPACTVPRFDIHGASGAIERDIRGLVRDGLSIYTVETGLLETLRPDVVITQDQCEVCAVSLRDVEAAVCDLTGVRAEIVSLHPDRLADVWQDIRRVAAALDVGRDGDALIGRMQARLDEIARHMAEGPRQRVAVIEWIDPPMGAGNWMPELLTLANAEPLTGEAGAHSPWLDWEKFVASDPDAIIVAPCGLDIARASADLPLLADRDGWQDMRAVREGRVALVDGHQYFNRPGPRLVDSLEILAEILQPERFDYGHLGTGWEWVPGQAGQSAADAKSG